MLSKFPLLELAKKAYHVLFEILMWLNLIACTVIGVFIGKIFKSNPYSPIDDSQIIEKIKVFLSKLFDGQFLGGFFGLLIGFVINIVLGGLIATVIDIDVNLESIRRSVKRANRLTLARNAAPPSSPHNVRRARRPKPSVDGGAEPPESSGVPEQSPPPDIV